MGPCDGGKVHKACEIVVLGYFWPLCFEKEVSLLLSIYNLASMFLDFDKLSSFGVFSPKFETQCEDGVKNFRFKVLALIFQKR